MKCQEETEQDQEVRGQEQAEAWAEAAELDRAEARALEVVLRQGRAVIASVPTAAKKWPINWGVHVMIKNALSVEQL